MKRKARALLYQFVNELLRDGDKATECEESISDEVLGVQLSLVIKKLLTAASKPIKVRGTHRRIISVLDYTTPKTQFQIYVKLGKFRPDKTMSGGFRSCCADLMRWNVIKHIDGGYVLRADVPADVLQHFKGILPKP